MEVLIIFNPRERRGERDYRGKRGYRERGMGRETTGRERH